MSTSTTTEPALAVATASTVTALPEASAPTTASPPPETTPPTSPPPQVAPTTTQPPPTAPPATDPTPPAVPAYVTEGNAALAQISFPWQSILPSWTIEFLPERSGLRGLTFPGDRRIEVYMRTSPGATSNAHVIAHEIGHALDVDRLTWVERDRWRAERGIPAEIAWFPNGVVSDFGSGAGDFAEAFATWQIGSASHSHHGGAPSAAQIALLQELVG